MNNFSRRISEVPPRVWILLGLVVLTLAIYGQTAWHPFISADDDELVYENSHVRIGLTWENIRWAFSSTSGASFWHPLTWLSHMLDVELFGMNAGGHHLMSAGIHALNAIVLFLVLARMTGFPWRSAFVAGLFAAHPLHVESVAWVAERKDVLSTLFFFLSLWAYTKYAERPGKGRYGLVALCFALSLMSKPMGVTLPFVLLLLDYWPLGRIEGITTADENSAGKCPLVTWKRALLEKVPLLLMSATSAALTLSYEGDSMWATPWDALPIGYRGANAVVSYGLYLWKTVWPVDLAVFYPHPGREIAMWKVGVSGLFLSAATVLAVRFGKRRPYLPVGWFFYLGTLVPVIGLIQVGTQGMADRYSYVPLTGVFLAGVWALADGISKWRFRPIGLVVGATALVALTAVAWDQTRYWKDDVKLYSRGLEVTGKNRMGLNILGAAYDKQGQTREAIDCYLQSLRINSGDATAWTRLAGVYYKTGQIPQAIAGYLEALRAKPGFVVAWNNLGLVYGGLGQHAKAIEMFNEAVRLKPGYAEGWYNLGAAHFNLGQPIQAISDYREAVRLKPDFASAWMNMGAAYEQIGNQRDAEVCYQEARRLNMK